MDFIKKLANWISHFIWKKRLTPQTLYTKGFYAENVHAAYFQKNEKFYNVFIDKKFGYKLYKIKFLYLLLSKIEHILKVIVVSPILLFLLPIGLVEAFIDTRKDRSRYKRIK